MPYQTSDFMHVFVLQIIFMSQMVQHLWFGLNKYNNEIRLSVF